jgi:hypothetical protein
MYSNIQIIYELYSAISNVWFRDFENIPEIHVGGRGVHKGLWAAGTAVRHPLAELNCCENHEHLSD